MFKLRRLWSFHVNIQVRLTLWYLVSLGFLLVLFGSLLHRRLDVSLQNQLDTALELAVSQTQAHVDEEDGRLVFINTDTLGPIIREFDLYLIAPDGSLWDSLGFGDAPRLDAPTPGYTTIEARPRFSDDTWRILSQPVTAAGTATTGWLQVAASLGPNRMTLNNLTIHICLTLPLILILAGGGSFFLASRALRPIDKITQTAQAISASDLGERINYVGPMDQVGRLATTFDRMLDRLQAGFERERRFTADAAHELRTPLTALKGRIGVTLSQPRGPDAYQEALREMEGQVDRLVRLGNDLLFMARLDHQARQEQRDEIALDDLLAALLDQVSPLAETKAITLAASIPSGLAVTGNMDLLIRLFLNLLDNAIRYTPAGGRVSVEAKQGTKRVCVHVSDTGPGIAPTQLPHLFERFYRAEGDRARRDGQGGRGAGLGLAIAREIAHAHGGTLTVESEVSKGSTFTLCLPVGVDAG